MAVILDFIGALFLIIGSAFTRIGAECWKASDRSRGKPEFCLPPITMIS